MENKDAFVLALIAGALLIISGVTGSVGLIKDIITFFAPSLPPDAIAAINFVLSILNAIAMLGGIAVIIGGVLVTQGSVKLGKFIIGLGAGTGLIGVIINLVTLIMNGALTASNWIWLFQSTAWVGIILSVIARLRAK